MSHLPTVNYLSNALATSQISFDGLVDGLLDHPSLKQAVSERAAHLCTNLHENNPSGVFDWAVGLVKKKFATEILALS